MQTVKNQPEEKETTEMKTYEVSVSIISDSESPLEAAHELINFMECYAREASYEVRDTETNIVEIIELDQI